MGVTTLIIPAFIAGLLTFLAPCTLPLVPAYLGFIGGTSATEAIEKPNSQLRYKIFFNGLTFVLGFSTVFVLFGVFAGYIGHFFPEYHLWVTRLGGIFVIFFGVFMLGVIKMTSLSKERRMSIPSPFARGSYANAFILGAVFSVGWTPCVGPILGSLLLLATTQGSVASGAFLLAVFALGLSLPFLLVAAALGSAQKVIIRITPYLNWVSRASGVLLIVLGVLLLTNSMGTLFAFL